MIHGINHITLAISDLDRSFNFYTKLLGLKPLARCRKGAYLLANDLWFCLTVDSRASEVKRFDYTHIAFSVTQDQFQGLSKKIVDASVCIWQENSSEGNSLYFLDPDGHKLEIHV